MTNRYTRAMATRNAIRRERKPRLPLCAIKDCKAAGTCRVLDTDDDTEYWFCDRHVAKYCEPREP